MPFPKIHERTDEAMLNPQVGDRFTEMMSFWLYIVGRGENHIVTMEAAAPCTFPEDGEINTYTLEDFRKRFSYQGKTEGYWIAYVDSGNDVESWW